MLYISVFFVSFLLVLALTPLFIRLAFKKNFLDYPDPRKVHSQPTPLLGGVSVFIGFLGGMSISLLSGLPMTNEFTGILIGGIIIIVLGLVDDKKGMQPGVKFLGQIIASFLFLLISQSLGSLGFGLMGDLLFLLWLVGLMNAFNFLDNMDGLCSGISFIAGASFLLIFIFTAQVYPATICLALMGALLGFLIYNFPPAKIFLGDTGSMFSGFILSALGIFFAKRNVSFNQLLVPMLILSYPIFDISLVTFTRLKEGKKIYQGGKDHTSHRFINLGFQLRNTLNYIYLISLSLGIMALLTFFFIETPWKVLIAFCVGILLAVLGAHLHRRFSRVGEKLILIILDILSVNSAFLFFYWLRFESGFLNDVIVIPLSEYIIPAIWITLYWLVLFAILGLYEIKCELPLRIEWLRVVKAVILGITIFSILSIKFVSLRFVLLYSVSLVSILLFLRTIFILTERMFFSRGIGLRKTIIVGTGERAREICKFLQTEYNPGFNVLGFVSEGRDRREDLNVLGSFEDLDMLIKRTRAEVLIFSLDNDKKGYIAHILKSLEEVEMDIVVREELSQNFIGFKKAYFYKGPWLRIFPTQLRTWELGAKRVLDFLISFVFIVILSPIWLIISFLVTMNYSGGILDKKRFLGKGGKGFQLLTFNSGSLNSQNKLGIFLRTSGLAKLPILFNVLKGEMSLVGPQPHEERSLYFSSELQEFYKRVNLKPGIFVLGQDRKEPLFFPEDILRGKIEDGLLYAEKISLWLDMKILLKQLSGPFFRRQDV